MKKLFLICVLLLAQHFVVLSQSRIKTNESFDRMDQDSIDHLHLHGGLVPYVLLSRSTGAYGAFTYKHLAAEYRVTYTIPTGITSQFLRPFDWNYFEGLNNFLILSYRFNDEVQLGVVAGIHQWSYGNEWIQADHFPEIYFEKRSGYMYGKAIGLELQKDVSYKHADISLFLGCNYSTYTGAVSFLGSSSLGHSYPAYTEARKMDWFNLTIGVKLGLRT
jgi:hypothetical protein